MEARFFTFAKLTVRLFSAIGLLASLAASGFAAPAATDDPRAPAVLFFGDSLTAGYGIDPDRAYPALIQERLEAAGLPHRVINAGLSGETTAAGLRRVDWILRQPVAVFVLALGGNDGLRGIPPEVTRRNLEGIIERVRSTHPEARILLAGMQAPPNMGPDFTRDFAAIFPELAHNHEVDLLPFLLEGVGGNPDLNLPDGVHPTPKGHRVIADLVWPALQPLLSKSPES
ncbi:MAG: arylesterase [Puniceicoccaceae bacterium]|nr:MAG: arylesterase [Puniceicoccaceae bacterium]